MNFSLFAPDAAAVELRLYEGASSDEPFQAIALSPDAHRTFHFWHVYVEGLAAGTYYTWRVAGPGQALDSAREILDPWARAVSDARWDRSAARAGRTMSTSLRGIVTPRAGHETGPPAPWDLGEAVIYELHVGGFTRHPSSGVRSPGTRSITSITRSKRSTWLRIASSRGVLMLPFSL